MKINYDLKMEETIKEIKEKGEKKKLLVHSCCGPCSSAVLEYLNNFFEIDIYFYNPNITIEYEYQHRIIEQKEMIEKLEYNMNVIEGKYDPKDDFFDKVKGLENEKEGGTRCYTCYDIRIGETARKAKEENYDFFTTVLSISPMKNVNYINELGEKYSKEYKIPFLYADFKKKNRYLRSIQISKELNMYRQDYCGCIFSKIERENYEKEKAEKEKIND
ncbi:epoxyqueuosine reductase QueH [Fusobacterium sp.]|uniref:epoxyqueuosine reductase QueH n=1 Tax=Fusobacterium sp. TaxID=68766 RepID=UPI0025C5A65A|nr:epoxyqueuosine reductase QueH [Fusobacterium sp.]MCI7224131.1 epoxyqueuosine reductase QueH [Fusobacterium sp.]